MNSSSGQIPYASVRWDEDKLFSNDYQDIYASCHGAVLENEHVFIDGNNLRNRFKEGVVNIAETGFGTGLNFLTCWNIFDKYASSQAKMHYFSVEAHPLSPKNLQKAHSFFPEMAEKSAILLEKMPLPEKGFHNIELENINLTLVYGDISDLWLKLEKEKKINAWFLDGFAPSKNETMWSNDVFRNIRKNSKPQTTLATYTASGAVRRGLESAGFKVQKTEGFGGKRHMTIGVIE